MNLQVAIADDEYFIRQRLKRIIPWEELDLSFSGEGENGVDILNLLKTERPDIVLLDIKMPKMNGIETAQYIYENHPSVKVIILSGYNEFEYARSTMKCGVSDYLLKPVNPDDLCLALKDCIRKIEKERADSTKLQTLHRHEQRNYLSLALSGQFSLHDLLVSCPSLIGYHYGLCMGIFVDDETDQSLLALMDVLHSLSPVCEFFKETDYSYSLLLCSKSKDEIKHLGSKLTSFIHKSKPFTYITLSSMFSLEEDWTIPYQQVLRALNQRFYSRNSDLHLEYEPVTVQEINPNFTKIRQKLILFINTQDQKGFRYFIKELFDDIQKKKNINYMQLIVTDIFLTYHIYYPEHFTDDRNMRDFISMIMDEEYSLTNLETTVISYGLKCMDSTKNAPSDVMFNQKITSFIQQHYTDPELSVNKLAEHFQMNASYMGTLFKKINNQSILQYLIQTRMDAAIKLMAQHQYRITDIAEMVGYSDVFYFSKRFKKLYGCSPKEYMVSISIEPDTEK